MTNDKSSIETLYGDILAPREGRDLRGVVGLVDSELSDAYVVEEQPEVRAFIQQLVDERRAQLRKSAGGGW